ncbi:MAG TPA: phage/plasmid replication protein [Burkholderiaceae bacterium]
MIDYYDIELNQIRLGPKEWRRIPGHEKPTRPPNRMHVKLKEKGWAATQEALIPHDSLRLLVCPQKVLGHWNCHGSDDLRQVVLDTAPAMLRAMGLEVTQEIMSDLVLGKYGIRKVHIAHQFWLDDRCIRDFLRAVRRRLNESHEPVPVFRGDGFMIGNRSRTVEYVFYVKLREFLKYGLPFYRERLAHERAKGRPYGARTGLERDLQRIAAAAGPRLEMRLGDHYFRKNRNFARGTGWAAATADGIYQQHLRKLELPPVVEAAPARVRARQRLKTALKTYLLWADGHPLNDIGTNVKTVASHRRIILQELGFDIRTPASAVFGDNLTVDARSVFDWKNRVQAAKVDVDDLYWLGDPYEPAY